MYGRRKHVDENKSIGISKIQGSALIEAAYRNNVNCLETLLNANASVDAKDVPNKKTALRYAAFHENFEAIKILLDYGANIEEMDIIGHTTLTFSCVNDQLNVSKYLVKQKANPSVTNALGNTILHEIIEENAKKGNLLEKTPETFEFILQQDGSLLEHENVDGHTPYLYACFKGIQIIMDYLKDEGASVNIRDNDGKSCEVLCHEYEAKRLTEEVGCLPFSGWYNIIQHQLIDNI